MNDKNMNIELIGKTFDAIFGEDEDIMQCDEPQHRQFDFYSDAEQCELVADKLRDSGPNVEGIGEALTQPKVFDRLIAALRANDQAEFGRIAIREICEYMAPIIEEDWQR